MMPTQWSITHQWATQPVGANTDPHCPIGALHGPIVPAMTLEGWQNALEKSRLANIHHMIHWGWIDIE